MPLKIVRNDITKMKTEAIVNTANSNVLVGPGCDSAIYEAAGYEKLLKYREDNIGKVSEGHVFITPGFKLQAKYIIHAVSPRYMGGRMGEERKLRSCYRKSLDIAKKNGIKSISFPLISTGGFAYPKEEGMRIAADEINAFLLRNEMEIFLVVFDEEATKLGEKIYPGLEVYINQNNIANVSKKEYSAPYFGAARSCDQSLNSSYPGMHSSYPSMHSSYPSMQMTTSPVIRESIESVPFDFEKQHESKLQERMHHMTDTYSEYLMYLIKEKHMENAEVWKRAIVDKKIFSKIKNNANYHPNKLTALCLCIGAKLNLDESKDLLARAGYALSPCDKTDIIFSYFIENEIYDMIELDIQLEEHGLPCIIS